MRVLLAGDETALPAISSVLESLPAGYAGHALLEVPYAEDVQPLVTDADVEVTWWVRGARARGRSLRKAVAAVMGDSLRLGPALNAGAPTRRRKGPAAALHGVDVDRQLLGEKPGTPARGESAKVGLGYAWVAGEAAMVRDVRRYLVRDLGIPRAGRVHGLLASGQSRVAVTRGPGEPYRCLGANRDPGPVRFSRAPAGPAAPAAPVGRPRGPAAS